tara:strand:+ start:88 stop:1395 length:1308 start_codon:yes stop_codon:yes gene_type:complete
MLSKKAKVLQPLGGRTMLNHVITTANKITDIISVVVGFDKEGVEEEIKKIGIDANIYLQKEQIGTADAVKTTLNGIDENEKILVLYGDVPLIKEETLKKLCSQESDLSILTTVLENPTGYGRALKDKENNVVKIIEERDADSEQKKIREIFTGILVAKGGVLKKHIPEIDNNNSAKEFYLTDLISIAHKNGFKIKTFSSSSEETTGANNRSEQEELERTLRMMKTEELLKNGATLLDKSRVDVRGKVKTGADCIIDVNVVFEGNVELGNNVEIGANTILCDTKIGDDTKILPFSHIVESEIGSKCSIGPYARLREGSVIMDGARVGNFVETKKTRLGRDSKANHFTYLGDAEVGDDVNIGAGTITCNYDGKDKHKTNIGDNSFVGTNSSLVAPVTIGKNAYVGAGSTITKDIPDNALGVGRGKQKNKENWVKTKK